MKKEPNFKPGFIFNDYRLEKPINAGQDGEVWEVTKISLKNKRFAAKFINNIEDKNKIDRFLTEISILAKLNNPHIITIIDNGIAINPKNKKRIPYYIMELLDPVQPLDEMFNKIEDSRLLESFCIFFVQICSVLEEIHNKKISHGDIKPANILIGNPLIAKLADFGFGLLPGISMESRIEYPSSSYHAPKNLSNEQADIYRLGRTFQDCLKMVSEKLSPVQTSIIGNYLNLLISKPSKESLIKVNSRFKDQISSDATLNQYFIQDVECEITIELLKKYFESAFELGWPVLRWASLFREQTYGILEALVLRSDFKYWERCLNLLFCITPTSVKELAKKLKISLFAIDRTPWRVADHMPILKEHFEFEFNHPGIPDVEYRIGMIQSYGYKKNQITLEKLLKATRDENNRIRRAAANVLGEYYSFASAERLINLLDDPDSGVQTEAIFSIGKLSSWPMNDGLWALYLIWEDDKRRDLLKHPGEPYADDQYEEIFPIGCRSNSEYFLNKIRSHFSHDSQALAFFGLIGSEADLYSISKLYASIFNSGDMAMRRAWIDASNLIDEHIFGNDVYQSEIDKTSLINRWWWKS